MTDYPQRMSNTFSERKRLFRLRRKKEKLRFWDEVRVIPVWLRVLLVVLYVIALVAAISANLAASHNPNGSEMVPWELRDRPALASLAMAGVVTGVSIVLATMILFVAYVNRDASRRGMSAALWTILVIILMPAWGFVGFVIYFLMREPLPYPCPQCNTQVGARFNFCPNCRTNLFPSCPNCKHEVAETDKFCPYCSQDLQQSASLGIQSPANES